MLRPFARGLRHLLGHVHASISAVNIADSK